MNKVVLTGRVTKQIEIRRTQSGKAVATFTLAVDNHRKDDGADFPVCVAWDKLAELLNTYVKKGHKIGVSGRLQTRSYESKGQKHFATEVVVEEIEFLEKKNQSVFEEPKAAQPDYATIEDDDSELPF